ncbi:hypothetical protein IFR05_015306 [Cadophora sp. M221]|nr:hypothetical protein IFR05_015306 [Cadophora sp. M221]
MLEGLTQSMRLEDIECETFGRLVNWMYNHTIERQASFVATEKVIEADVQGREYPNLYPLVKLWKLGDRTLMPDLQNEAITMIYSLMDHATLGHIIDIAHFVCLNKENSMLKAAVIGKFVWCWGPVILEELGARLRTEIFAGVALQLKQRFRMEGNLDQRGAEDFFVYDSNVIV